MSFIVPQLRVLSALEIEGQCGVGTYGSVYKGRDKVSGDQVALKKLKMEHEKNGFPITALREIRILRALKHENIVQLLEIIACDSSGDDDERFKPGDVFMVFEYLDFDLEGLLKSDVHLTADHIRSYTKQLLDGVCFMHRQNILHRDLKGANILITRDNRLKIGDWGLARSYMPSKKPKMTIDVVTLWYRSPELCLKLKEYGEGVDIWACGCIFLDLHYRRAIMTGETDIQHLELIYQLLGSPEGATRELFSTYPEWGNMQIAETYTSKLRTMFQGKMNSEGLDLVEKMLTYNPNERISAFSALDCPYFFSPRVPELPQNLPKFTIENGHEFEVKQAREKESQNRILLAEQKRQEHEQKRAEASGKPKFGSTGALSSLGGGNRSSELPKFEIFLEIKYTITNYNEQANLNQ